MVGFSKPSFIFYLFPPSPHYQCCLQVSETVSWHKLWFFFPVNMLQHWVGGRDLICFCKVDHSRISINISRNGLGLNNLCAILQDPAPKTPGPRSRTAGFETQDLRLKNHNPGYRTWGPWSGSKYLISIPICSWREETVVIDNNFP